MFFHTLGIDNASEVSTVDIDVFWVIEKAPGNLDIFGDIKVMLFIHDDVHGERYMRDETSARDSEAHLESERVL